jgi:BMFP domain-containing protein YqiC
VRDMALKARAENKKLEARITELEAKLSKAPGEAPEAAPKRSAKPSPKK